MSACTQKLTNSHINVHFVCEQCSSRSWTSKNQHLHADDTQLQLGVVCIKAVVQGKGGDESTEC